MGRAEVMCLVSLSRILMGELKKIRKNLFGLNRIFSEYKPEPLSPELHGFLHFIHE
jgi:hypothetical protein